MAAEIFSEIFHHGVWPVQHSSRHKRSTTPIKTHAVGSGERLQSRYKHTSKTMPSIKSLTLSVNALNDRGTFSEGDTVSGEVKLDLYKETTVETFFVKCKGDAHVHWSRKSGNHTYTYSDHRRYFKRKQLLVLTTSKDYVLPRGLHVYKFQFTLPQTGMPSSFSGAHGKIVYTVEAKLCRSWRMDCTAEKNIKFVSKTYHNLGSLMSGQVSSADKRVGFFSKGKVHMEVRVDRVAFAPGETAVIHTKINNTSSSDMIPKFSLIQDVVYRAKGSTRTDSSTIEKMVAKSMTPQTEHEVKCEMKIPQTTMTTILNCEVLSVEYHLKVYLDISFAFDPEVIIPVTIIPHCLASGVSGALEGRSHSDFASSAAPMHYPASPNMGGYAYQGAHGASAPPPPPATYSNSSLAYPPGAYGAPPTQMSGRPPRQPSPYGSPFRSSSSSPVLHPPPYAPPVPTGPPLPAQNFPPAPSAPPVFNMPPPAPSYSLATAPTMNTDFLSQNDEAPPSYSLLFPSSSNETSNAEK